MSEDPNFRRGLRPASEGEATDELRGPESSAGDPSAASAAFVGPLEAGLRHPGLVALPLVLLLVAAVAFGLLRSPVYSSEARVNVGDADVPAFTLQGVVIGNQTLAAGYARTIVAEPVVRQAAQATGLDLKEARAQLTASPIPGSTLIRVDSEDSSERGAVRLANVGAEALIGYVRRLNRENTDSDLLARFRLAETRVQAALRRVQAQERQAEPPTTLPRARLDLKIARLEAQRLSNRYQSVGGDQDLRNLLQLVAPAARADSDFGSMLQRLLLVAVAAGLVLGLGLALLKANRRLLRRPLA